MTPLDPIIVLAARWAIALLLVLAALEKLRHPLHFQANLREYDLLPGALVAPVARVLPLYELGVAAGALFAATAGQAMLAAGALFALYAGAMTINLLRGRRDIDCGCMGPGMEQTLTNWLVFRNGLLIAVAFIGAAPMAARDLGAVDVVVCLLAVAAGSVLYAAMNQLTSNVPRLDALDAFMEKP